MGVERQWLAGAARLEPDHHADVDAGERRSVDCRHLGAESGVTQNASQALAQVYLAVLTGNEIPPIPPPAAARIT